MEILNKNRSKAVFVSVAGCRMGEAYIVKITTDGVLRVEDILLHYFLIETH